MKKNYRLLNTEHQKLIESNNNEALIIFDGAFKKYFPNYKFVDFEVLANDIEKKLDSLNIDMQSLKQVFKSYLEEHSLNPSTTDDFMPIFNTINGKIGQHFELQKKI